MLPVILAATSLTFLLGELSSTWPPIILNGDTTAIGLKPLLANTDLPSLTVSRSTSTVVALGEDLAGCTEVALMILWITLLVTTVGSLRIIIFSTIEL